MKSKICLLLSSTAALTFASNCWKDAYGRGVGYVIDTCADGLEKDGALCYPLCKEGYYGVGPVCWQECPEGFTNTGAHCLKPSSYGRGAGYISESSCLNDGNTETGCETWGLLWYPKCKANFHNAACCVCSPDCPSEMTDIGVSCQKLSYGRGVGYPLGCSKDLELSGALCYPYCKNGYSGNGPVCWEDCSVVGKQECGGALCVDNADNCTSFAKGVTESVIVAAVAVAAAVASGGSIGISTIIKEMGSLATDLANAVCDPPTATEFFLY